MCGLAPMQQSAPRMPSLSIRAGRKSLNSPSHLCSQTNLVFLCVCRLHNIINHDTRHCPSLPTAGVPALALPCNCVPGQLGLGCVIQPGGLFVEYFASQQDYATRSVDRVRSEVRVDTTKSAVFSTLISCPCLCLLAEQFAAEEVLPQVCPRPRLHLAAPTPPVRDGQDAQHLPLGRRRLHGIQAGLASDHMLGAAPSLPYAPFASSLPFPSRCCPCTRV